jgi:hypothetical protein
MVITSSTPAGPSCRPWRRRARRGLFEGDPADRTIGFELAAFPVPAEDLAGERHGQQEPVQAGGP